LDLQTEAWGDFSLAFQIFMALIVAGQAFRFRAPARLTFSTSSTVTAVVLGGCPAFPAGACRACKDDLWIEKDTLFFSRVVVFFTGPSKGLTCIIVLVCRGAEGAVTLKAQCQRLNDDHE
jgi:hypothetical protein